MTEPYELVVAPPSQRALVAKLPEPLRLAVIDFLTTALVENLQRVGPIFEMVKRGLFKCADRDASADHIRAMTELQRLCTARDSNPEPAD